MAFYRIDKSGKDTYYLEEQNVLSYYIDKELANYERLHREVTARVLFFLFAMLTAFSLWIFNKLKIRLRGKRAIFIAVDIGISIILQKIVEIIPRLYGITELIPLIGVIFMIAGLMRVSCLITILVTYENLYPVTVITWAYLTIIVAVIGSYIFLKYHNNSKEGLFPLASHIISWWHDIISQFWIYRVFNSNFH